MCCAQKPVCTVALDPSLERHLAYNHLDMMVQIFEYLQLDLKKYMGQDKKKSHLPVKPGDLKVCAAWLCNGAAVLLIITRQPQPHLRSAMLPLFESACACSR